MKLQTTFEQQVLQGVEFKLPPPSPAPARKICPYAKPFHEWCGTLIKETSVNPTDISVNLAQLYLQENFFACLAAAPSACRKHFSLRHAKVRCLMELYREHYAKLFALQRQVVVPRLREPSPPPVTASQLQAITLGEILGDA